MFGILLFLLIVFGHHWHCFCSAEKERYEDNNGMWNGHPTEDSLRLKDMGHGRPGECLGGLPEPNLLGWYGTARERVVI
jgi:hypothetical protein